MFSYDKCEIYTDRHFQLQGDYAVSIGKFDGLHIGHQKLLQCLKEEGGKRGLKTAVLTFSPSPEAFFSNGEKKDISSTEQKIQGIAECGVDAIVVFPFDQDSASMDAETFLNRYLIEQMHAKCIVAGTDVRFGHFGMGNANFLYEKQPDYHYDLRLIDKVEVEGICVSSTEVRLAIEQGDMEKVIRYLGRPYEIQGIVIHGNHIGHELGMPTANVELNEQTILPKKGVYLSETVIDDNAVQGIGSHEQRDISITEPIPRIWFSSITNIGCKPTIEGSYPISAETYLNGFTGDLYGQKIRVHLLKYLREERRFDSLEALKVQLEKDRHLCINAKDTSKPT